MYTQDRKCEKAATKITTKVNSIISVQHTQYQEFARASKVTSCILPSQKALSAATIFQLQNQ